MRLRHIQDAFLSGRFLVRMAFGVVAACFFLSCSIVQAEPAYQDGDIIFHTSRSGQSLAIQRATHSRYSHVGMIVHRKNKPFVLEAVSTVRYTPLAEWIARGEGGHYVVKRLKASAGAVTPATISQAAEVIKPLLGKHYDFAFDWSDKRMYCSELVWKIYERTMGVRIGELSKLGDFDLTDEAVQKKLKERYGSKPPLDEPVISPAAMFDSELLETVEQGPGVGLPM